MFTKESEARLLNDLIFINNDRVVGYQKAIDQLQDVDDDLRDMFQERVNQSTRLKSELKQKVADTGSEVESGTTNAGKLYRFWMDVKAYFGGADRQQIIDNCDVGEEAAILAYKRALSSDRLSDDVYTMVNSHYAELKVSHSKIVALRNTK